MEEAIFYKEWLPLPKAEFNVLAMIAEQGGSFTGNYADMCRYLGVTPQNRNNTALRNAIESLIAQGFISCERHGRTNHLTVIPKATEIRLPRRWVQSVIQHDYSSEAVAFAPVLKVFIWIAHNDLSVVTNGMIAEDLNVSVSTVVSAKNVLEREYENITKRKISEKIGNDVFRNLGQELTAGAWWTEI
ncbi:MAG: hypothetical protein E7472_01075 [Ruminococcaceae bacterium]|nr:hypothetical protein [Oscillospiraceae bacterium]